MWLLAAAVLVVAAESVSLSVPSHPGVQPRPSVAPTTPTPSESINGSVINHPTTRVGSTYLDSPTTPPADPLANESHKVFSLPVFAGIAVVVAALFLGYRWVSAHAVDEQSDDHEPAAEFDIVEPSRAAAAEEWQRTAADRRRLLAGDDPRTAVRRAWIDVQAVAEASGVPRRPSETSSEFTARTLSRWSIHPTTLEVLARGFREAEFSQHEITDATVTDVRAALEQIERAIVMPTRVDGG